MFLWELQYLNTWSKVSHAFACHFSLLFCCTVNGKCLYCCVNTISYLTVTPISPLSIFLSCPLHSLCLTLCLPLSTLSPLCRNANVFHNLFFHVQLILRLPSIFCWVFLVVYPLACQGGFDWKATSFHLSQVLNHLPFTDFIHNWC